MADGDRKMNVTVPIKYGREGDKTYWHNIGTAFENEKGQITIYLNSLPIPGDDGKVKIMLFDKKDDADRDHGRRGGGSSQSTTKASTKSKGRQSSQSDVDDEIPF